MACGVARLALPAGGRFHLAQTAASPSSRTCSRPGRCRSRLPAAAPGTSRGRRPAPRGPCHRVASHAAPEKSALSCRRDPGMEPGLIDRGRSRSSVPGPISGAPQVPGQAAPRGNPYLSERLINGRAEPTLLRVSGHEQECCPCAVDGLSAWELACHASLTTLFAVQRLFAFPECPLQTVSDRATGHASAHHRSCSHTPGMPSVCPVRLRGIRGGSARAEAGPGRTGGCLIRPRRGNPGAPGTLRYRP